jgi:RNA polymerase sigma factor (TIGR02999 family)
MAASPGDITLLLSRVASGDRDAEAKLIPIVYGELRRLAAHYMRQERADHTLQATALVHEAFLKLFERGESTWENRKHFFAMASQAMRRILVDHARNRKAEKRDGDRRKTSLDSVFIWAEDTPDDLVAVDEALCRLANWDARQCQIVEMRFFGGLSVEEIAEVLGVSTRTVKRDWNMARAWLHGELSGHDIRPMGASKRSV